VLVLCDPRLSREKATAACSLIRLPPLPRTRELDDVQRFLAAQSAA
jgi:hypothetical protein